MKACYQLDNVQMLYGTQCVLDIPALTIEQGQTLAILGQNGAGKSTLLALLALLLKPSHGGLLLSGEATQNINRQQRRRIGLVAQQPYLLPGSVADNIALALRCQHVPKSEHAERIRQALHAVNLTQLAEQDAATLSGGELKRAALARVLAYQPDILLLDEPFSHLDSQHIRQLEQLIQQLGRDNRTIIFTTHDRMQAHALADQHIHLHQGRLTSTPLLNVFHGHFSDDCFDTGKLKLFANPAQADARHIAIDPREIIISSQPHPDSSARNQLQGRLTQIAEEGGDVRLNIDCGEIFQVVISPESLQQLQLRLGDILWLNFKASAVTLL
jgi:molybdopterin-binding protein